MIGRAKRKAFSDIKDRFQQKLQTWKEKMLLQGKKEVLLKVVVLAFPTYTMNCFNLPNSQCFELEIMIARFWWDQRGNKQKIYWLSWKKLCETKFQGGLGFKDLKTFNLALLAKKGWRLVQFEDTLLHKVYKARYFPHGNFFELKLGTYPSYAW